MSNTFCVTITECKTNEDKATVGFVVANAALGSEKDTANGGKILVCSPCMKKRGITEDMLVPGATPAGGAALVEWLSNGSPSVGY
jgi:predicted peroxiredoxin